MKYLALAELVLFDDWLHQRVALRNVGIHLRYHGTGPPILLIHGNPQHSVNYLLLFSNCGIVKSYICHKEIEEMSWEIFY